MDSFITLWTKNFFEKYHICDTKRVNIPVILADLETTVRAYLEDTANNSFEVCVKDLLHIASALPEGFAPHCFTAHFDVEAFERKASETVKELIVFSHDQRHGCDRIILKGEQLGMTPLPFDDEEKKSFDEHLAEIQSRPEYGKIFHPSQIPRMPRDGAIEERIYIVPFETAAYWGDKIRTPHAQMHTVPSTPLAVAQTPFKPSNGFC